MMRKLLSRFIGLFLVSLTTLPVVQATHYMGVDITYECLGPCTIRIFHKTYYDCTGAATSVPVNNNNAPGAPFINFVGNTACAQPVAIGGWQFVSYTEVTPLCPDLLNPPPGTPHPTGCQGNNNPTINGVSEAVYYQDYNFCNTTCTRFTIEWGTCCRNYVIDSGASGNGIFSGSTTIDLTITPCNSSPTFLNPPVPYICAGQTFTFNQGAFDPDGDSLSYELGPCFDTNSIPVAYNSGFSPTSPLGPSWDVQINPLTGDITMTPSPTGNQIVGVMCITVKEWRNGVLIGQVSRDMQITVIPNCTSTNPQTGGVTNIGIGADNVPAYPLNLQEVKVCPGAEICFDIPTISQSPTLNYTMYWNQGIPGATFADATNPAQQDTITGAAPVARFCWTPPINAEGAYFFLVTVQDDACPVPGLAQFTVIVYVEEALINSQVFVTPTGCNEVALSFTGISTVPSPFNTIFPITNWNGNGNLNLNPDRQDSAFTHLYPAPGSYFYTLTLEDTFGCRANFPGIVDLTTGVTANAGADVTICSNYTLTLGTPALPGQNYQWFPPTALSATNVAQPTFNYPNNGLVQDSIFYVLMVWDTANICTTYDYTSVYINPTLQTSISPLNPTICIGDSIVLTATGNVSTGNTYLWSTGETTQSITVDPNSTTTYSVVTFNNGCSSDLQFTTVQVVEGPPGQIAGDREVCPGGSTTLTAAGGASYLWSAAGFSQPSITLSGITDTTDLWVIPFDANGCPGDTVFTTLVNSPKPEAGFTPNTGCQGIPTQFQDTSIVSEGVVVSWEWDFGDGTTASVQNPAHTFTTAGIFIVQLIVETERGCRDTATIPVQVYALPNPDFTIDNACQGQEIDFANTSTIGTGTLVSATWNFGDGLGTDTGNNPSYIYSNFGFYNVALTVTSDRGCPATRVKSAVVHPNPTADFQVLNACQDSVVFLTSASVVEGSFDFITAAGWDFGDITDPIGNFSTSFNPTKVYQNAGIYTVTLAVVTDKGCMDTTQREVRVYPKPTALFTYDQTCENTFTQFVDGSLSDPSSPLAAYRWNFGDGNGATGREVTHRYQDFGGPGTYRVYLAIATADNCVDTAFADVVINPAPFADFAALPVCVTDSLPFVDESSIAYTRITQWDWDFGDGNRAFVPNPSYRYRTAGTYRAQLTVTSDSGCSNQIHGQIIIHPQPELPVLRGDTVCFGETAFLRAIAAPGVTLNWYNNVDDTTPFLRGNSFATPPLPFQTIYFIEPETEYGCVNTRTPITASVHAPQTLAIEASSDTVELPLAVVNFSTVSSIPLVKWEWTFADGNTSTVADPSHEYQFPGIYSVVLNARDENGCPLDATQVIEVRKVTNLTLPSAFSPNGDGVNDTYKVGHYKMDQLSIQIFNRWGQIVFEAATPDFEWNGKDLEGKDVPEGVYIYVVNAVDVTGQGITESRSITVMR
jgi:gliding motility-associated-like protein